ncbi:GNAT family N-acetyltransferase [Serratia proteamaculans]
MCEIIIRHSENNDIPALQQLFSWPEIARNAALPLFPSRDDIWRRISEPHTKVCSLVACLEGDPVGHLLLEPEQDMQRRHVATFSLCVAPEHQSKGIGSLLMQSMLVICDESWALERVELMVFSDNQHAVNLYKKFGFETEALCKKYTLRGGMLSDVYQMVRFRRKQVSSNLKLHKGF